QGREKLEEAVQGPVTCWAPLADLDVLDHCEIGEDEAPLGNPGHARPGDAMGGPTGDRCAIETDGPTARGNEAHDGLDRRRLADPVSAKQGRDPPSRQLQINALEDMALAVV